MKLVELKNEIGKYQYFEDTDVIDITLASVIATRLKLGDPIWLILIGPSSGGKSQVLRPVSITDTQFLWRIDDLTENTLLSGAAGGDKSLLTRIGTHAMIVVSDLTVIFSKSAESRATILSQFRMLYDGEMTKYSGNKDEPMKWKGYLGVLAGSTPSIYANFEEVADMGERFIYYRMKPFDAKAASKIAAERGLYGRELDEKLAAMYADYIKAVVLNYKDNAPTEGIVLSDECKERVLAIAILAEKIRTTQHLDWRGTPTRIPVPAFPMRVMLQLISIAKALGVIAFYERKGGGDLDDREITMIEWCGYSLANEEKRSCLRILASVEYGTELNTPTIANQIGLDTEVIKTSLQNLAAVGVLVRDNKDNGHFWKIKEEGDYNLIRRLEGMGGKGAVTIENSEVGNEEKAETEAATEDYFNTHF